MPVCELEGWGVHSIHRVIPYDPRLHTAMQLKECYSDTTKEHRQEAQNASETQNETGTRVEYGEQSGLGGRSLSLQENLLKKILKWLRKYQTRIKCEEFYLLEVISAMFYSMKLIFQYESIYIRHST